MIASLEGDEFKLIDGLREKYGLSPITFGDVVKVSTQKEVDGKIIESEEIVPRESKMTSPNDHGSVQSLDYIFEVRKNNYQAKPKEPEKGYLEVFLDAFKGLGRAQMRGANLGKFESRRSSGSGEEENKQESPLN